MITKFEQLVCETVDTAFINGVRLFAENLNNELEKDALFEHGFEASILNLLGKGPLMEGAAQNIDESDLDAMLAQLEEEEDDD